MNIRLGSFIIIMIIGLMSLRPKGPLPPGRSPPVSRAVRFIPEPLDLGYLGLFFWNSRTEWPKKDPRSGVSGISKKVPIPDTLDWTVWIMVHGQVKVCQLTVFATNTPHFFFAGIAIFHGQPVSSFFLLISTSFLIQAIITAIYNINALELSS